MQHFLSTFAPKDYKTKALDVRPNKSLTNQAKLTCIFQQNSFPGSLVIEALGNPVSSH